MEIKTLTGIEARDLINPFYERAGRQTRVAETDILFVAFINNEVAGAVRFCIEEETPLLRGMFVVTALQRKGLGKLLLHEFEKYLTTNKISDVLCLPYGHLQSFYSTIGFKKISPFDAPAFLLERYKTYLLKEPAMLIMRRD